MALIDELKQKRAECDERYKRVLLDHAYYARRLNDLDTAIAALEPAPEEHLAPFADTDNFSFWEVRWDFSAGYYDCQRYAVEADALAAFDVLHAATLYKFDPDTGYVELGRKSKHVVPAQAPVQPPSAELRSVTPAIEPESGLHVWTAEELVQLSAKADAFIAENGLPQIDAEPTELDAPASIVDDPELQAAVARAEATLQEAEPAYVGLQDPELDADYDAMREREKADKPKLHFSIFGERGNRKLEDVE